MSTSRACQPHDRAGRVACGAVSTPTPEPPAPPVGPVPLPDGRSLATHRRTLVMGVVNVTDDSFSDGGEVYPVGHPDAAVALGGTLLDEGADLIDVGGESSRPGARPVDEEEELRRVLPVVQRLASSGAVVSIDTVKPGVARAALAAGASIVNDVSAARSEELLAVTAAAGAAYVLMHTRGTPADMQDHSAYDDVLCEVHAALGDGLSRCSAAGIATEHVLVDPGIGFAKDVAGNLALLGGLDRLRSLGRPLLLGTSRKSFLGTLLAQDGRPAPAGDRLEASLATAVLAAAAGVGVVRVHDVHATVRALRVAHAVRTGVADWPPGVVD